MPELLPSEIRFGIDADSELRAMPNPLRGRRSPSLLPGVHGYLRYHTADQVINGIENAPVDFAENPYLLARNTDPFPDELLGFLPPNIFGQAFSGLVGLDGQRGTFTLLIPAVNFRPPTFANTVILTDDENIQNPDFGQTDPFGGDYSG